MWVERGQTEILDPEVEECFSGEAWCCVNISSDVTTEGKIPAVGRPGCANKGKCFECLLMTVNIPFLKRRSRTSIIPFQGGAFKKH